MKMEREKITSDATTTIYNVKYINNKTISLYLHQDIDESENADDDNQNSQSEQENLAMDTLETAAGDSTPVLLPPDLEGESPTESPDDKPPMEVFDLQESSSESISPDMESHALFIKLKEVSSLSC